MERYWNPIKVNVGSKLQGVEHPRITFRPSLRYYYISSYVNYQLKILTKNEFSVDFLNLGNNLLQRFHGVLRQGIIAALELLAGLHKVQTVAHACLQLA